MSDISRPSVLQGNDCIRLSITYRDQWKMFIAGLCLALASLAFVALIAEDMSGGVIGVAQAGAPPRSMRDRPMTD